MSKRNPLFDGARRELLFHSFSLDLISIMITITHLTLPSLHYSWHRRRHFVINWLTISPFLLNAMKVYVFIYIILDASEFLISFSGQHFIMHSPHLFSSLVAVVGWSGVEVDVSYCTS